MIVISHSYGKQLLFYINVWYLKRMFAHSVDRKISLQFTKVAKDVPTIPQYLFGTGLFSFVPDISATRRLRVLSNTTQKVSNASQNSCWNCTRSINAGSIFCDSCSCLQPIDKRSDLFAIIGIKSSFTISSKELKQKYRDLQSILHPDKFSSKSKKEQELSEEYSSFVNKAYTTLLDPLERGLYLLKLQNVTVEENATDIDKLFLMQIMGINEELEDESDPHKISECGTSNRKQINSLVSQVEEAFKNNNQLLAKELLTKLKYYYSIEKKIKEMKQKLNIPD